MHADIFDHIGLNMAVIWCLGATGVAYNCQYKQITGYTHTRVYAALGINRRTHLDAARWVGCIFIRKHVFMYWHFL